MLASDLSALASEARAVVAAGADYIHLEVMDGHFVENISWGPPVITNLRQNLGDDVFFDCHMQVSDPLQWVQPIRYAGGSQYTFHIEACGEGVAASVCAEVREAGMKFGIALNPGTPVSSVAPVVNLVDMVLVMSVEPGFGGQTFMPNMMPKILQLRTEHPDLDIGVEGGLNPSNIDKPAKAGANMIVAGSALFKPGKDPAEAILALRRSVEENGRGVQTEIAINVPSPAKLRLASAAERRRAMAFVAGSLATSVVWGLVDMRAAL